MNKKDLKQKALDNLVKHILSKAIDKEIGFNLDSKFYHIVTSEMAEKISDIYGYGDDYANAIGRYAYISFYGEPMTEEEILNFDASQMTHQNLMSAFEVQDLGEFKNLSECHYQNVMDDNQTGLTNTHIGEIVRYTIMEEMERQNQKK